MSLHIHETGTPGAPGIVFLHGVGASGWMWQMQTAALSDFHCLVVDLPGHGRSSQVPWLSLEDTARQVAEIIRACAAHGQAHVVGLSLGGYIALVLLERYSSLLKSVIASGVTAAPMPYRVLLRPQLWLMSRLLRRRSLVTKQAQALHLPPEMEAAFIENVLVMSMQAYRQIWKDAADFRLPSTLRSVHVPTLITAGARETKIITQAVSTIASLMPNARGCLAPGLGHGWNVEAPDLFSAMVRAWILGAPLPSRLQPVPADPRPKR